MSHEVKLKKLHKIQIITVLADSEDYKEFKKGMNEESVRIMKQNYHNAAQQIVNDPVITCGRTGSKASDNLFGWIKDQIQHSGKIAKQELGIAVIAICEAAGEGRYAEFNGGGNMFNKLFGDD
jgi:hypothetical protein